MAAPPHIESTDAALAALVERIVWKALKDLGNATQLWQITTEETGMNVDNDTAADAHAADLDHQDDDQLGDLVGRSVIAIRTPAVEDGTVTLELNGNRYLTVKLDGLKVEVRDAGWCPNSPCAT